MAGQLTKRQDKKIKYFLERGTHEEGKNIKKLRKFNKTNRKEEVREKIRPTVYEDNEDSDILSGFEKIKKVTGRYKEKPDKNLASPISSRKTFSRPAPLLGKNQEKGIAANIDQIIIVASIKNPPLKSGIIDRFLLIGEKNGFEAIICINKVDLTENDSEYNNYVNVYSNLGYRVIPVSAIKNKGIEELKNCLKGKCSLFIGHSGVGKSSLLNALEPSLGLRTGEISDSTNKGKHTTTSTRLMRLSFGAEVFDVPGIKQMGLTDIEKDEISGLFREFGDYRHECEFSDCSHIYEEHCGIKKALVLGKISSMRYDSYVRIFNSI